MKFFHYSQNNSGGDFISDDTVDHHVIIEAKDAEDANKKAESIGIYFDGCETGDDCECCGDRWSRAYGEGDETPKVYDKPVAEYKCMWGLGSIVYKVDGTIEKYSNKKKGKK